MAIPSKCTVNYQILKPWDCIVEIILGTAMSRPASTDIEQGVIDAIKTASRRPIEPMPASELVADLGFDSLQVLDVIAELEGRFDISIPLDKVPATRTVAQIVAQVTHLLDARGAAK